MLRTKSIHSLFLEPRSCILALYRLLPLSLLDLLPETAEDGAADVEEDPSVCRLLLLCERF